MFRLAALPLLLAALSAPAVHAQTSGGSNVTCTYAFWEFNDMGNSPCYVWGQLQSLCLTGGLTVTPLLNASYQYSPPSLSGQINDCNCNVVSYNLMAACSWCQPNIFTNNWVTESQWKQGCSSYDATGVSGVTVSALDIPGWAFLPDNGAAWDPNTAQAFYNTSSSSTTHSSSTTTSAANTGSIGGSTSTDSSLTTSASPSGSAVGAGGNGNSGSSGSSSNTGAIVGGVVGGVVGLILIAGLIFFLVRRSRKSSAASAAAAGGLGAGAAGAQGGQGAQWGAAYGEPEPAMSQYSAPPRDMPYSHGPASPFPPGTTPSPYPYQPGSTPGATRVGYEGSAPPTSYAASPPPGGYYEQPAYGQPYGAPNPAATAGRYTGLPEA